MAKYRDHQVAIRLSLNWLSTGIVTYVVQVETPDPNEPRCLTSTTRVNVTPPKNWSRYLSLYHPGYGARGIGFRDSSQDTLGVITHMPEEARGAH